MKEYIIGNIVEVEGVPYTIWGLHPNPKCRYRLKAYPEFTPGVHHFDRIVMDESFENWVSFDEWSISRTNSSIDEVKVKGSTKDCTCEVMSHSSVYDGLHSKKCMRSL